MASKKEILDKLAAGEISVSDAAQLLNQPEAAVETVPTPPAPTPQPESMPEKAGEGETPAWFRVRVVNAKTGKNKVSVNIPIRVLRLGLKIGGRFAPELRDLDWNELDSLMQDLQTGLLVEVQDEESDEHVQVFIE